jgi:F-type H+-transporting ATPase subunit epsilon
MEMDLMNLKILLPFRVFADLKGIKKIVAETPLGSFGLLPHRLDCVAALAPGILIYETDADGEKFVAIDEGILVKTEADVFISVRNAIEGTKLGNLHKAVQKEFLKIDENEKKLRSVLARIELNFIRRLEEFRKNKP